MTFREGDIVRIPGERGTAEIRSVLHSMHGVLLKKSIGGFRRWNLDELRLVKRNRTKAKLLRFHNSCHTCERIAVTRFRSPNYGTVTQPGFSVKVEPKIKRPSQAAYGNSDWPD